MRSCDPRRAFATVNMDHIKRHYYMSHTQINPTRIVPAGPRLKFMEDAAR